jgi:CBS-domain-containing membrane protein
MSTHQRHAATREAASTSPQRHGPTPERYGGALERYLAAVADIHDHDAAKAPAGYYPGLWRLSDIQVRDVMTPGVVFVDVNAVYKEIVAALALVRVSAVPVVDTAGRVVGIVSESDLVTRLITGGVSGRRVPGTHNERRDIHRKSRAETAGTLMTSPPVTIRPNAPVVEAARTAAKAHVRRLPVVDDAGMLVGIVTRSDLLAVFLRDDDEIREHVVIGVLANRASADSSGVEVTVHDGVVTLAGQLERRMQIAPLIEATRAVAGVVSVRDELTYRVDDRIFPVSPGPMH